VSPGAVTADDPYAEATAAGIHRLAIPTPFAVGRVNVYLIEDEPLTLVDAGPNSGRALDELQRGLASLGHAVEDIGLIILTHQHIDHLGLVDIVAGHSGADVAVIESAVPFVENYSRAAALADEYAAGIMLRHGISEDVVRALRSVSNAFQAWGARADVTRPLRDGETIELSERTLEVRFRPGHSPTDTIFHDRERRTLIAADHLLKHISSNPLIALPVTDELLRGDIEPDPAQRPESLVIYLESLRATREMDVDLVLPGHGDPITDHRALIDSRFAMHERRAEKIFRLIAERPRTAYDLAQALWGNIAVTQAFLTLSEILGHTDLLRRDGRVREVEDEGGVVRFEASG
jgi:glyoxylase-like metal-dependent hydrolase (beta-lactamase superfamily II)